MARKEANGDPKLGPARNLTRRELARVLGAGVVGAALPAALLAAPNEANSPAEKKAGGDAGAAAPNKANSLAESKPGGDARAPAPLNRFPRMVQEYFVHRVREIEAAGYAARDALKTKEDAEQYVASCRERIARCFGPMPERTPLNAKVTGTVDREAYKIEKVIFESRPGFFVTANLYVPKGRKQPLPGVIGTCGHSSDGKANEVYQSFAQGLARQGYVVLIYDPIGQGERLQYPNEQLKSRVGVGVNEHLLAGNQQFLVEDFLGTWRAWDGIRALDYLLTREEVDPRHVGVTGNSGGGTMTTWLVGLERRWTMAAPSCFVTTFRRNLENELPADTEQCPPRALALGLDHADFIAAMAPRPVILLGQEQDYFDRRGIEEAYGRLRKIYALLAEENLGLFIGPQPHGYHIENRVAMYQWFNKITGVSDAKEEPKLEIEKEQTLWCTPRGQVGPDLKSRTVMSFTADKSKRLAKERRPLEGASLRGAVAEMLRLPPRKPGDVADYRILRALKSRGYPKKACTTYAVETEPGIQALVHLLGDKTHESRPTQGIERAVLYVADQSSDAELREEPLVRELIAAEPESAFYAVDVRGIGESRPDTCGENTFLTPYGSDYFHAIHSVMLDRPYPGQRTHDLLRVLDWLAAQGHKEIHVAARGWGTIPATFAALLSPAATQVTLKGALPSYAELAETELYKWPLSAMVLGVLRRFDLPDCYKALEGKKLKQIEGVS